MSAPTRRHRLEGLEPDNLMAFLALLGCLRALDCARPKWRARASFDVDTPPLRPVLHLAEDVSSDALCEAIAKGACTLLGEIDLGSRTDLKVSAKNVRESLRRTPEPSRFEADLQNAMSCDAGRPDDDNAAVSPLCFPTVAQVNFVASIRELMGAETPSHRDGSSRKLGTPQDAIERALLARWARADRPSGLRWDHSEARMHAYQRSAPTDEQPTTEYGAVRLALIGLSCFPVLPSRNSSVMRTPVPGGGVVDDGFTLTWPIWRHSMSLPAIRRLIAHPLATPADRGRLGVAAQMRAARVTQGKYIAFTRALHVQV